MKDEKTIRERLEYLRHCDVAANKESLIEHEAEIKTLEFVLEEDEPKPEGEAIIE